MRAAMLWGAGLCWAGFVVVAVLMESHRLAAFDLAGLTIWRQPGNLAVPRGAAWLAEPVRDVTALGGVLLRNFIALLAVAVLAGIGKLQAARRLVMVVGGGWLLDVALKAAIGRTRPLVVPHLMAASGSSFPSGHSFNAATVYVGLALVLGSLAPRGGLRKRIVVTGLVISVLVALSRVWLGVHYPSDALAGWLGGVGWALLMNSWPVREPGSEPVRVASGS